ncbi:MAG: patatin-like phospholipase family protein [Rhodospirillales bacterium]
MRDIHNVFRVMFVGLLLGACVNIPLNAYVNEEAGTSRTLLGMDREANFSGAFIATSDVPWKISYECRRSFSWDDERAKKSAKKSNAVSGDGIWPTNSKWWKEYCDKLSYRNDKNFVALALSGGGHRAAAFAAAVMFELQDAGVLKEVDVISSVSGGSITAAYYALSCDQGEECLKTVEGTPRPVWSRKVIFDLLSHNLELRWFGNWFWPDNIVRYWFTAFDRSDIMAETIADNLYDTSFAGNEGFRFHDLNPRRPALILNATDFTENTEVNLTTTRIGTGKEVGSDTDNLLKHLNFTFTVETFSGDGGKKLCSDINLYPISNAVMASSAFPAVFPFVTLRNYCLENSYIHLFDGGTSDNTGLLALKNLQDNFTGGGTPKRVIVIQVDASLGFTGKPKGDADPRGMFDYIVDTNALDSVDTLMLSGNKMLQDELDKKIACRVHIALRETVDDDRGKRLSKIGTRYKITTEQIEDLKEAAKALVRKKLPKFWHKGSFLESFEDC